MDFAKKDRSSLIELLLGFFHFYGKIFNYREQVISVRTTDYVSKNQKVMLYKWSTGCTLR